MVLIEEGTGTWCAWCPEGQVVSRGLLREYAGEVIIIEVHAYDVMELSPYKDSISFQFYPSGNVNRKITNLEPRQWESGVLMELNEIPAANVIVELEYDALSRGLSVHIDAEVFENLSGDYRLSAIIVEDAVTGNDESYNQKNIFSNNTLGLMGGFEILPTVIPYQLMVYDHIARQMLGGYNGAAESLPTQMDAGSSYSYSFDWTLPDEYNEEYIWVAALLIDQESGHIINAGKSTYLLGNENAKPFFISEPTAEAHKDIDYNYQIRYHDSDHHSCKIEMVEPVPSWLNLKKGRFGFAELEGVPDNLGTYDVTIRLTDADYTIDQTFQIEVKDSIPPFVSSITNDFLILPNPNSGVFIIEYDHGTSYQICDELGRVIVEGNVVRNLNDRRYSQAITVEGLDNGIYFFKIYGDGDFMKTKKLVISEN